MQQLNEAKPGINNKTDNEKEIVEPSQSAEIKTDSIPESFLIKDVPFQPQAPFANWDEIHDEACEEASIIIVDSFLNDRKLDASDMDQQILSLVDWQNKKWGGHYNLTVSKTAEMANEAYNLRSNIITNATIKDIKKEIANNRLVIVPTAGRMLGNPYFRQPGPVYHMVVVIGYKNNAFIVHDVGTKRGENYLYPESIFYNAIHDWNGSPETIAEGAKTILTLSN